MVGKSWKPVKTTGMVTIWCRILQIMIWYLVIFYWFLTTRDGCGCCFWWSVFIWCQDHTNIPILDEFAEPLKTLTQVLQLQGPMGRPSQASFRGDDCKASWPRRNRSGEKRPQLRRSQIGRRLGIPLRTGYPRNMAGKSPKMKVSGAGKSLRRIREDLYGKHTINMKILRNIVGKSSKLNLGMFPQAICLSARWQSIQMSHFYCDAHHVTTSLAARNMIRWDITGIL